MEESDRRPNISITLYQSSLLWLSLSNNFNTKRTKTLLIPSLLWNVTEAAWFYGRDSQQQGLADWSEVRGRWLEVIKEDPLGPATWHTLTVTSQYGNDSKPRQDWSLEPLCVRTSGGDRAVVEHWVGMQDWIQPHQAWPHLSIRATSMYSMSWAWILKGSCQEGHPV